MRRSRRASVGVGSLAAGLVSFGACATQTEITVRVSTDLPCDRLTTTITGGRDVARTTQCGPGARADIQDIGSVVLVPSDATNDALTITVVAARGKSPADCDPKGDSACIVARRKLRYIAHQAIDLPIEMRAACLGQPCDPDTTCVLGACVPAQPDDPAIPADLDAASTYDANAFVDATLPDSSLADAAHDVVSDSHTDGTISPNGCTPGTLATVPAADPATLHATSAGLFWVGKQIPYFYSFATRRVTTVTSAGSVARIAASGTTMFYAPATGVGVFAVDILSSSVPRIVDKDTNAVALYASEDAPESPFYTDLTLVYANGAVLFPLTGVVGSETDIAVTPTSVGLTIGSSFFLGPRVPRGSSVGPKLTGGATFHDLGTNGAQLMWIVSPPDAQIVVFDVAGGAQSGAVSTAVHLGVGTRVWDADISGPLELEAVGFPIGGGAARVSVDPGPVVGRIVPRPDCVYYWVQDVSGGYLLRSVPPP